MGRSNKTYRTEAMLRKIHQALQRDLLPTLPHFATDSWFLDPRDYTGPMYNYWEPYHFKVMYQLEHFYKRVLLDSDPSEAELTEKSFQDFKDSQANFGLPPSNDITERLIPRVQHIVSGILGEFDFSKFSELCSFGKRAAYQLPYRKSYLDNRVNTLNGSQSQFEWFKAVICNDIHLHRACRRGMKNFTIAESLRLQAVPKSFKAMRIMCPDSTVGGFLSRGLGLYLRGLLEAGTHINLRTQQQLHRQLALNGSIDGKRATIDMSKASDSYVWEHVEAFVPESWWSILDAVRIPNVLIGEDSVDVRSCMLMGSGHTFPLQTILFYSIVKAVLELMGSSAKVDVYGDDIIFPTEYHSYVIASLHHLGFSVNVEKSFVSGPFRESCGGDYHTGVDVRPFMPEHVCTELRKHEYTECLHKWFNGLIARWDYVEVPGTLDLILNEILSVWGNLCPIPISDPDTFGVKYIPPKYEVLTKRPVYRDGLVNYLRLMRIPARRKPKEERIYYWCWLHKQAKPQVYEESIYEDVHPTLDLNGREAEKGNSRVRWVVSN